MKSIILQMHEQLINGEKTPIDFVNDSIEKINAIKHTNSVVLDTFSFAKTNAELLNKEINNNKDNLLFGIPYAMKDSICTKGIVTTGGSMFLKDFIPPYSATIFSLLNDSKTIMMCKSNLDEFGMGGTGLYSAFGHVKNFHNLKSIVGGSSSGSTNLVAASAVPFAIGTDTGDSARRPPSFAGVVGFKPTYGLISRYGVLPYAPSLDHVGIITRTVADAAIVSEHLIKYDEKDFTSQKIADTQFFKNIKIKNKLTVGVVKHIENYLSADVLKVYLEAIDLIKANGHTIKYVSFDEKLLQAVHAIYYAITYSEANSCWANLTGITFGSNFGGQNFDDIIEKARTKNLGNQIKRRYTIGQYITKKENFETIFLHSQKMRRLLANQWNNDLASVDTIMCAGASSTAPLIEDVLAGKPSSTYADDLLCVANFTGTPSIAIPCCKIHGMPVGLNFNCRQFEDQKAFDIALTFEELFEKKWGSNE